MTATYSSAAVSADQLRTMSVAARLYYIQEIRQRDIANRLGISQARVSRLLRQAEECGVVRTVLRDFGFRLDRTGNGLRRRRGLLTKTDVSLPARRIPL